jgi:hypothetical protein
MLLQQQPLVLQSKGNYIIVKSWSLALIILSLKSTAHGYGIALISGNNSCQLLLLWGTWASLQSQEKSISPFGVGHNKKKPKSVCYRLCFSSLLGLVPVFNQLSSSETWEREAKRPRELRIQDSSERMQRQETRELRIQSPLEDFILFLFFSLFWVMTSVFFFSFLLFS